MLNCYAPFPLRRTQSLATDSIPCVGLNSCDRQHSVQKTALCQCTVDCTLGLCRSATQVMWETASCRPVIQAARTSRMPAAPIWSLRGSGTCEAADTTAQPLLGRPWPQARCRPLHGDLIHQGRAPPPPPAPQPSRSFRRILHMGRWPACPPAGSIVASANANAPRLHADTPRGQLHRPPGRRCHTPARLTYRYIHAVM
jgi:hypothetical protein